MAAESSVTEAGLKALLAEKIGAVHVDIEDMSGTFPAFNIPEEKFYIPLILFLFFLFFPPFNLPSTRCVLRSMATGEFSVPELLNLITPPPPHPQKDNLPLLQSPRS